MQTVALETASAQRLEMVAAVRAGDEVILLENERPVAKLVAFPAGDAVGERRPRFGSLKGKIIEREDCWEPVRKAGSAKGLIIEREDCWEPETEMWKEYMP